MAIRFGNTSCWQVDVHGELTRCQPPALAPLENLEAAIDQALQQPIDFPSVDQALVPGDSLVLAVDPVLPARDALVSSVAQWFVARGTSPENICVVVAGSQAQGAASSRLLAHLADAVSPEIRVEWHDPDEPDQVAYVAANLDADPIYMNRTLVDADVVIPLTCCRPKHALDYLGAYGIYPLLSDRATRGTFYNLSRLTDSQGHGKLTAWADQAAMWAGFMVEIQAIPAAADRVGMVLAGLTDPLESVTSEQMRRSWETRVHPSPLTIALLDGGPAHQDWLGIARALHNASRCTADGGAIVVCTEADVAVGKSMARLRGTANSEDRLQQRLAQDAGDDTIAAAVIHQAVADKHVYLVSHLAEDTVEGLGLGVVRNPQELSHLTAQFPRTLVLDAAQHRDITLLS